MRKRIAYITTLSLIQKIFKGKDQIIDGPKTTTVTNETWPINDTSTSVKKGCHMG